MSFQLPCVLQDTLERETAFYYSKGTISLLDTENPRSSNSKYIYTVPLSILRDSCIPNALSTHIPSSYLLLFIQNESIKSITNIAITLQSIYGAEPLLCIYSSHSSQSSYWTKLGGLDPLQILPKSFLLFQNPRSLVSSNFLSSMAKENLFSSAQHQLQILTHDLQIHQVLSSNAPFLYKNTVNLFLTEIDETNEEQNSATILSFLAKNNYSVLFFGLLNDTKAPQGNLHLLEDTETSFSCISNEDSYHIQDDSNCKVKVLRDPDSLLPSPRAALEHPSLAMEHVNSSNNTQFIFDKMSTNPWSQSIRTGMNKNPFLQTITSTTSQKIKKYLFAITLGVLNPNYDSIEERTDYPKLPLTPTVVKESRIVDPALDSLIKTIKEKNKVLEFPHYHQKISFLRYNENFSHVRLIDIHNNNVKDTSSLFHSRMLNAYQKYQYHSSMVRELPKDCLNTAVVIIPGPAVSSKIHQLVESLLVANDFLILDMFWYNFRDLNDVYQCCALPIIPEVSPAMIRFFRELSQKGGSHWEKLLQESSAGFDNAYESSNVLRELVRKKKELELLNMTENFLNLLQDESDQADRNVLRYSDKFSRENKTKPPISPALIALLTHWLHIPSLVFTVQRNQAFAYLQHILYGSQVADLSVSLEEGTESFYRQRLNKPIWEKMSILKSAPRTELSMGINIFSSVNQIVTSSDPQNNHLPEDTINQTLSKEVFQDLLTRTLESNQEPIKDPVMSLTSYTAFAPHQKTSSFTSSGKRTQPYESDVTSFPTAAFCTANRIHTNNFLRNRALEQENEAVLSCLELFPPDFEDSQIQSHLITQTLGEVHSMLTQLEWKIHQAFFVTWLPQENIELSNIFFTPLSRMRYYAEYNSYQVGAVVLIVQGTKVQSTANIVMCRANGILLEMGERDKNCYYEAQWSLLREKKREKHLSHFKCIIPIQQRKLDEWMESLCFKVSQGSIFLFAQQFPVLAAMQKYSYSMRQLSHVLNESYSITASRLNSTAGEEYKMKKLIKGKQQEQVSAENIDRLLARFCTIKEMLMKTFVWKESMKFIEVKETWSQLRNNCDILFFSKSPFDLLSYCLSSSYFIASVESMPFLVTPYLHGYALPRFSTFSKFENVISNSNVEKNNYKFTMRSFNNQTLHSYLNFGEDSSNYRKTDGTGNHQLHSGRKCKYPLVCITRGDNKARSCFLSTMLHRKTRADIHLSKKESSMLYEDMIGFWNEVFILRGDPLIDRANPVVSKSRTSFLPLSSIHSSRSEEVGNHPQRALELDKKIASKSKIWHMHRQVATPLCSFLVLAGKEGRRYFPALTPYEIAILWRRCLLFEKRISLRSLRERETLCVVELTKKINIAFKPGEESLQHLASVIRSGRENGENIMMWQPFHQWLKYVFDDFISRKIAIRKAQKYNSAIIRAEANYTIVSGTKLNPLNQPLLGTGRKSHDYRSDLLETLEDSISFVQPDIKELEEEKLNFNVEELMITALYSTLKALGYILGRIARTNDCAPFLNIMDDAPLLESIHNAVTDLSIPRSPSTLDLSGEYHSLKLENGKNAAIVILDELITREKEIKNLNVRISANGFDSAQPSIMHTFTSLLRDSGWNNTGLLHHTNEKILSTVMEGLCPTDENKLSNKIEEDLAVLSSALPRYQVTNMYEDSSTGKGDHATSEEYNEKEQGGVSEKKRRVRLMPFVWKESWEKINRQLPPFLPFSVAKLLLVKRLGERTQTILQIASSFPFATSTTEHIHQKYLAGESLLPAISSLEKKFYLEGKHEYNEGNNSMEAQVSLGDIENAAVHFIPKDQLLLSEKSLLLLRVLSSDLMAHFLIANSKNTPPESILYMKTVSQPNPSQTLLDLIFEDNYKGYMCSLFPMLGTKNVVLEIPKSNGDTLRTNFFGIPVCKSGFGKLTSQIFLFLEFGLLRTFGYNDFMQKQITQMYPFIKNPQILHHLKKGNTFCRLRSEMVQGYLQTYLEGSNYDFDQLEENKDLDYIKRYCNFLLHTLLSLLEVQYFQLHALPSGEALWDNQTDYPLPMFISPYLSHICERILILNDTIIDSTGSINDKIHSLASYLKQWDCNPFIPVSHKYMINAKSSEAMGKEGAQEIKEETQEVGEWIDNIINQLKQSTDDSFFHSHYVDKGHSTSPERFKRILGDRSIFMENPIAGRVSDNLLATLKTTKLLPSSTLPSSKSKLNSKHNDISMSSKYNKEEDLAALMDKRFSSVLSPQRIHMPERAQQSDLYNALCQQEHAESVEISSEISVDEYRVFDEKNETDVSPKRTHLNVRKSISFREPTPEFLQLILEEKRKLKDKTAQKL